MYKCCFLNVGHGNTRIMTFNLYSKVGAALNAASYLSGSVA